ncbi:MAG: hypothetical protein IK008_04920 [Bacteroidales bacterium]|nr:hypothetical protein [Bacteroidales bacterium]
MKVWKVIRIILLSLLGLIVALLVTLQILLRPAVLTRIVNNVAADYVDGDVSFKEVRAHFIKSFPYLTIDATEFSITYPHERYARFDSVYTDSGRRFSLLKAGYGQNGVTMDTLAAFNKLSIAVNYMAFINSNRIHVHRLELERPRIFAHYYDSTAANWEILPIGKDKDTTDKESKPLPPIIIDKIALTDRPIIIFTHPVDTLFGMFTMRRMNLDGRLETEQLYRSQVDIGIDSLFVSGRIPADTVAVGIQQLRAGVKERHFTLDADARASLRTGSYGRIRVPVHLDADAELPEREEGELEANINSLCLSVSSLTLKGKGNIFKHKDGIMDLDVTADINDCPIGDLIREFEPNFPVLKKVSTDAILSLNAAVKGSYGNGQMPAVDARVQIPPAFLNYEGLGRRGRLALDATVTTDDLKEVNGKLNKLFVDIVGAQINATADIQDALGKDPSITLNGSLRARVDSLTRAFTNDMGIYGTGRLDAKLNGKVKLSQLNMARIGAANLNCDITGSDLHIERDSLNANIPHLEMNLCTKGNEIDKNIRQGARVLALKADVDSLDISLGTMYAKGKDVHLLAQNSAEILKGSKDMTPLMGILKVASLRLRDSDGMAVGIRDNTETIRIEPATQAHPQPKFTVRSKSGGIRARLDDNLVGMRDLKLSVSATRHVRRTRNSDRWNHMLDSLQRVYPGVPRDSLFRHARMIREARASRDAFASADIKISLSQSLKEYFRDWDVDGSIGLGSGRLRTPSFPLATDFSAVEGRFDNDTLDLKNITLKAGESDLSAKARLTGLRWAVMGSTRRPLKLKADVTSDYIDANELMRAYAYYTTYQPADSLNAVSDEALETAVDQAELPDSVNTKLLVIPANLEVDFSLEARGIKYDSLRVSWAAADVAMRNRTLQITNALAASNMGDIFFEGFYATRSKEDIKAGFDLNLVDITAQKVITLFPAVDTLMPLLTTFVGDLDCELAATTDLDTLMQVVLPSVDGVMKISGKELGLRESPELRKITKLLKFKDKTKAVIDNMSVTGIVQDNVLEIFPFVLNVDRYLLAASGTQGLDQKFDYHISIIKSPMLIKFGVNIWGPNFDDIHYGLGRARYKSANVPVYTKQLDNVQYNLVAAIHNIFELGVEKAMEENRTGQYFAVPSVGVPSGSSDEPVSEEALQGMEYLLSDILQNNATRREAIKQEVIRLEEEAADKSESAGARSKKKK